MNLRSLRTRLVSELERTSEPLHVSCIAEPELARFSCVSEALVPSDDAAAIVLALIRQWQRTGASVWSSALVVAMYPMLAALKARLHAPHPLDDDRDAIVVSAFLSEAARLNASGFGALAVLRRATERSAYLACGQWRRTTAAEAAFVQESGDGRLTPDPELVIDLSRGAVLSDVRDVSLRAQVESAHGEVPAAERERLYQRLKKQRTRERNRLRQAPLSTALAA